MFRSSDMTKTVSGEEIPFTDVISNLCESSPMACILPSTTELALCQQFKEYELLHKRNLMGFMS